MKVLIIGMGSIAQKHINALKLLVTPLEIDALRSSKIFNEIDGVKSITEINPKETYSFAIISNPTATHYATLLQIIPLNIPIFLEKPPLQDLKNVDALISLIHKNNSAIYVAYNLRFLNAINELKRILHIERVNEVNIYCGSFLPQWRPNTDFRLSYSAHQDLGGGVNLDLIHELDYTCFIFGSPIEIKSIYSSRSSLDIKSNDYAHYTLQYEHYFANITLNYYRKDAKREIEVVCENRTLAVDLLKNVIIDRNKSEIIYSSSQSILDTYTDQMKYFLNEICKSKIEFESFEKSLLTLKYAIT
jgi:predicted dehydrogenase